MKIINILVVLCCIVFSSQLFAKEFKPIACKDFKVSFELKQLIATLDENFSWNDSNCKIVGTKSIFPQYKENGKINFAKGLQLFVYQNDQLKFICLPGWECKSW